MKARIDLQHDSLVNRLAGLRITDEAAVESWRTQVYQRLDAQRRQIRVLKLFPSADIRNDPEGELYTLDLIDVAAVTTPHLPHGHLYSSEVGIRTFAAVSYAWGDTNTRRCMLLNGRRCKVGINAHEALRYLRRAKEAIHIWIDTLCINQADVRERSQQMSLMKDIYSLACAVYIWTGPGVKPSYKAIGTILRMALVMGEIKSEDDPEHTAKKRSVWKEMQKVTDADWDHVLTFVTLPIWRRVWVQQEITLSSPGRKVALVVAGKLEQNHFILIYGARAIWSSWNMFSGPRFVRDGDATQPPMEKAVRGIYASTHISDCWIATGSIPPQLLFMSVQDLEAKDPKDYVYGLLGLLPYLASSPDYEKTLAEVYTEAMFRILKRESSLAPIQGLSHHWRLPVNGMPSWVKDWRQRVDRNYRERWSELGIAYNACNGHPVRLELDRCCLKVAAYHLFTVNEQGLGPLTEFDYQTMRLPKLWRDFAFAPLGFVGTSDPGTYMGFDQVFETTLLLDLDLETPGGSLQRLRYARTDLGSPVFAARQIIRGQVTGPVGRDEEYDAIFHQLCTRLRNTRIAFSPKQQLCILPAKTQTGDVVCILRGCNIPFAHRRTAYGPVYEVVGGAYVHGVMDGEAIAPFPYSAPEGAYKNRNDASGDIWLV